MQRILLQITLCILPSIALSQDSIQTGSAGDVRVEYICRMYCTDDVSLTPAKCRVCGMEMEDRKVVENPTEYRILSPQETLERIKTDRNIVLLDVRSRQEYNDELGHLKHSILIPIDELEKRSGELAQYKDKTIIAYCSHGIRSARAAKLLTKKGFSAFSLMGGLTKWNREHKPVVREK
jgi:phage shock protein E